MATVKTLISGNNKLVINVTHTWVTADETNVIIIDRSGLVGPDRVNIPGKIRIDEITWSVSPGLDTVKLSWDFSTDEVIENIQGAGYMDYRPYGGKNPSGTPATATEGDVLLSTVGGAVGDSYSLLICCTLGL
jgi:hypothetical protein